ncbi:hypothetical protein [Cryptosporangium aurantiacum]|uniref:Uncharacterized protein n=1 Tax=Cryptosporangium aurantiacum TaxID=134849 RepID=A0A1M7IJA3_9ACTN|nr:hypothetical protein [Cryptosporangium aurantiacum]SHM40749.1 hypothetical protein SAMN05443668_101510 [Cryptosporangium aurantiacum]
MLEALPDSIGTAALPSGRSDTDLRVAIAGRRPIRRVVRVARVVLALVSAAAFAGWAVTNDEWTIYVAFGALALIALGGLTSWPLASFGGWSTRSEAARVVGDWLQAVTLALGCLGLLVGFVRTDVDTLVVVGGVGGILCLTLGWLMPATAWLLIASRAQQRERPVLERYQRLAQRDEVQAQKTRTPERFPALPAPVLLRPQVDEPVTLVVLDDSMDPEDFDSPAEYAEWISEPELTVRADPRRIEIIDEAGRQRTLLVGGRGLSTPDPDAPGGPVASMVVIVAAGLKPESDEPTFDADTEAALRRLVGDVDRVALVDAAGRRVVDLPDLAWTLRELVRLAGAAGIPCLAYRLDEDVIDRAEGRTPTGVDFGVLEVNYPAAPDLIDLVD